MQQDDMPETARERLKNGWLERGIDPVAYVAAVAERIQQREREVGDLDERSGDEG